MSTRAGALLMDDDTVKAPARRGPHPIVKPAFGLAVGGPALALVVSTAGGIGDALDAVRRMRAGFVVLAIVVAAVRVGLYGLQLELLGQRSGRLGIGTAYGLALVVYGIGAVTPASPAEGLAIASRELRRRGRTTRQARLTVGSPSGPHSEPSTRSPPSTSSSSSHSAISPWPTRGRS
jgi:hypothetical protein